MNTWVQESLSQNGAMIDTIDWHSYTTSHYDNAVQARAWSASSPQSGLPREQYISEWEKLSGEACNEASPQQAAGYHKEEHCL
jgi:hypothetical protein